VKYIRERDFINVDIEKGMQDGQVESKCVIVSSSELSLVVDVLQTFITCLNTLVSASLHRQHSFSSFLVINKRMLCIECIELLFRDPD